MKISEQIELLEKYKSEHGDIEVFLMDKWGIYAPCTIFIDKSDALISLNTPSLEEYILFR